PDEALQHVVAGSPVVLVGPDAEMLGRVLRSVPDRNRRERLLAVLVGDPSDPEVLAAAAEMAGELWPWAEGGAAAETVS
ncbi:MAG TPA: hypothetical protein VED59_03610, partial [Acidimicrobiales bacterium]|nr:hypothetical protein [Acidimicrobiales bacterium]